MVFNALLRGTNGAPHAGLGSVQAVRESGNAVEKDEPAFVGRLEEADEVAAHRGRAFGVLAESGHQVLGPVGALDGQPAQRCALGEGVEQRARRGVLRPHLGTIALEVGGPELMVLPREVEQRGLGTLQLELVLDVADDAGEVAVRVACIDLAALAAGAKLREAEADGVRMESCEMTPQVAAGVLAA